MRFHVLITQLSRLVLALSIAAIVAGMNSSLFVQAQAPGRVNLSQFDLLTAHSGWILLGQNLFWTSNAGQTWDEISPSVSDGAVIQDVEFIDPNTGWVLWTITNPDGSLNFQLAQTVDNGLTWTTRSLSLFGSGEIASYAEKAEMGWFDTRRGWISVKQTSGSNFSIGELFTTEDGGNHWRRFAIPVADNVYFGDPESGWAVGGPGKDQIFQTLDAGVTWKNVRPADIPDDIQARTYLPATSGRQSLLVLTTQGAAKDLRVYTLDSSDDTWLPKTQLELDVEPGMIGLSILDTQNFVATVPGTSSMLRMENGKLSTLENRDGFSGSIVALDMLSLDRGWAKSIDSSCLTAPLSDRETASVSCSSTARLLSTDNGGVTWQTVNLPHVPSLNAPAIHDAVTMSAASALGNTAAMVGQGFDRCEIPTLSQMQTWSEISPYQAVNLYIGGSSRACANNGLISSFLSLLSQQGWKFIPTWVGPQAPCTGYSSHMSSDVATAYGQGVNEANLAVDRLAELGLTDPDKTGSVVYYDIENYGTDSTCRSAVNSFMNGWVSQVRARGNLAGAYGSTLCNTGLSDFLSITNLPDVIWPARWYHNLGSGYYDPNANVWNLGSCLPNTVWANHQRIRQYEGDHDETWGNLTLDVDSNAIDGVVAIPYDYPFASSIVSTDPNPTNAKTVHFTISFSKSVTGVNKADFALITTGVVNASIASVSGSGATYTVTVNTGTGDGTVRLDVADDDTIRDGANNPLGGAGTNNGNFSWGEVYTILKSANTAVTIGGQPKGNYAVASSPSLILNYPNTVSGPVKIKSLTGENILASQRSVYGNSFNELMGYPADQFAKEYWFPWYDGIYMNTWILVGNPSSTQHAYVDIYIGGVKVNDTVGAVPYDIPPGDRVTPLFPGLLNGPVRVVSVAGSGTPTAIDIFASERSTYLGSFNEVMGVPVDQFTTEYWFPWYDGVYMNTWILVGNPSSSQHAYVDIYINGVKKNDTPYDISPSGNVTPMFKGELNGPVRVVSVTGLNTPSPIDIFTSERSTYGDSFNEVMGIPLDQFTTEYWFPWVDQFNTNNMKTWVLVGNPSSNQDAYVDIYIAGVKQPGSPFTIPAHGNITPTFATSNGPVRVVSVTGLNTPSPIDIFASERTLYGSSFNEMMGYPADQLTTEYWFTWYDNIYMNTDIYLSKP